jgi:hypothetical protein
VLSRAEAFIAGSEDEERGAFTDGFEHMLFSIIEETYGGVPSADEGVLVS